MREYIVQEIDCGLATKQESAGELVRCYDCKYFQCNMRQDGSLPPGVDEYECRHWCGYCDPTDFCSRGEKKDDEQEN